MLIYYRTLAADSAVDNLYFHLPNSDTMYQADAGTLQVTATYTIDSSGIGGDHRMFIKEYFYFVFTKSTIANVCRWNPTGTAVDCINYGTSKIVNFYPITSDKIFFGTLDSTSDYLLMTADFSSPTSSIWSKKIVCPSGTG